MFVDAGGECSGVGGEGDRRQPDVGLEEKNEWKGKASVREPRLDRGSSFWFVVREGEDERGNEKRHRLVDQRFSGPSPFERLGMLIGADEAGGVTKSTRAGQGTVVSGATGSITLEKVSRRQTARCEVEVSSRVHFEETSRSKPTTLSADVERYDEVTSVSVYSHDESTCRLPGVA